MCFESSKLTVEYHEYGSQDSNNVETQVKPSCVHRETVASTKAGKSCPAAAAVATAAAILYQGKENEVHLDKERNPSRLQNLDNNFSMTCRKHSFDTHLHVCLVRNRDEHEREEARATHWEVSCFQY